MPKHNLAVSTILDIPLLSRIIVGIGEVSNITGVSARQLRYWESKGIISSIGDNAGTNRKYDYTNIEKIILIKDFLDQGFTLEASAKRLEERILRLNEAIVQLANQHNNPIQKSVESIEDTNEPYHLLDGEPYRLLGYATHSVTKEKLAIYLPSDKNQEKLLAKPLEEGHH